MKFLSYQLSASNSTLQVFLIGNSVYNELSWLIHVFVIRNEWMKDDAECEVGYLPISLVD